MTFTIDNDNIITAHLPEEATATSPQPTGRAKANGGAQSAKIAPTQATGGQEGQTRQEWAQSQQACQGAGRRTPRQQDDPGGHAPAKVQTYPFGDHENPGLASDRCALPATHSLKDDFAQITVGTPATFRNLTLFPLLRPEPACAEPDYQLAEDAMVQGLAQITELADGGSVPELRLENNSPNAVLLLDGEELIGAKQNRVLNLTILAPPKQVTILPVSCVEAGRWHMESPAFRPASHMMYARARAARTSQVTSSMRSTGTRRSDQAAVWSEIAGKASRMDAHSPTQAMAAVYNKHAITTEEYVRAFNCAPLQAGVVFAIDGHAVGMDLFDHPYTLQRLFPKLVRSYALDAMETATAAIPRRTGNVPIKGILEHIAGATIFTQPAVGLGQDVRISGSSMSGGALWAADRYIHICAFAMTEPDGHGAVGTRISRPTRRRHS
jgi:hypothetical protein